MFSYTQMNRFETRLMMVLSIPIDILVILTSAIYFEHWFWIILSLTIAQIFYSFVYSKCYSYLGIGYKRKLRFAFYVGVVGLQLIVGYIMYLYMQTRNPYDRTAVEL